jgi:DNA invertase Pin-like site-specific DNA recombinase
LADVRAGKITIVVVYKVDRLTRSLADFAKLVELFDEHGVSFVSITQILQYHLQHGSADPQRAALLCPV